MWAQLMNIWGLEATPVAVPDLYSRRLTDEYKSFIFLLLHVLAASQGASKFLSVVHVFYFACVFMASGLHSQHE
jgi:hypothetical protein